MKFGSWRVEGSWEPLSSLLIQYFYLISCHYCVLAALCKSGATRLVSEGNSHFRSYGRVEICIDQAWSTICDEYFDSSDASVICHQLGFSRYGNIIKGVNLDFKFFMCYKGALSPRIRFTGYVWPLTVTNLSCNGSEITFLSVVLVLSPSVDVIDDVLLLLSVKVCWISYTNVTSDITTMSKPDNFR